MLYRRLGEIATLYVGLPAKVSDARRLGQAGNLLTVRALTGADINLDELEAFNFNGRDVDKYRARTGDALLSSRSTSLKTAIVPRELDGIVINATLVGVRCLPYLDPRLFVAWLDHSEGRAALESVAQSGTAQMNITVAGLSKLEVPVPPLDEQARLVKFLKAADEAYSAAVQAAEERQRLARHIVVSQLTKVGASDGKER